MEKAKAASAASSVRGHSPARSRKGSGSVWMSAAADGPAVGHLTSFEDVFASSLGQDFKPALKLGPTLSSNALSEELLLCNVKQFGCIRSRQIESPGRAGSFSTSEHNLDMDGKSETSSHAAQKRAHHYISDSLVKVPCLQGLLKQAFGPQFLVDLGELGPTEDFLQQFFQGIMRWEHELNAVAHEKTLLEEEVNHLRLGQVSGEGRSQVAGDTEAWVMQQNHDCTKYELSEANKRIAQLEAELAEARKRPESRPATVGGAGRLEEDVATLKMLLQQAGETQQQLEGEVAHVRSELARLTEKAVIDMQTVKQDHAREIADLKAFHATAVASVEKTLEDQHAKQIEAVVKNASVRGKKDSIDELLERMNVLECRVNAHDELFREQREGFRFERQAQEYSFHARPPPFSSKASTFSLK